MHQLLLLINESGKIEYPINIREKFPTTSFPDILTLASLPAGVHFVKRSFRPEISESNGVVEESTPIPDKNGGWIQVWIIREYTQEELDAIIESKRQIRNKLLIETDWSQLKDIPDSVSNIYAKYRQELRDITNHSDFPFIEFPESP